MNYWIQSKKPALLELLQPGGRPDGERRRSPRAERRLEHPPRRSLDSAQVPRGVVIKQGEHGALLIEPTRTFYVPAFPLENVFDPTGAGDAFAGGFMAYLARTGSIGEDIVRRAMVYGAAMGSYAVEQFGIRGFERITLQTWRSACAPFATSPTSPSPRPCRDQPVRCEAAALGAAGTAVADAAGGADNVLALACDVSKPEELARLADAAYEKFGEVSFLMNNAGVGNNPGKPWENLDAWKALIDINFWGVVHGVQAFGERMLAQGTPAIIVNTGSKQGITTPPGNLAYNVSKAALKTYTEGLAHALRNAPGANISAHLLIPGFTFTGMTDGAKEKPAGAWTGEQVVDFMLESLARGDFYILCPDNETSARPTSAAWPGRSATSSRTARRCRAGIPTIAKPSRHS